MKIPTDKSFMQRVKDHLFAVPRLTFLSDAMCERLGLTSINAERIAQALPLLRGRVLDVGCGENLLVASYAGFGVGVDVFDWGGGAMILRDTSALPFRDAAFDTVAILAALNHIPNREAVLREVHRVLAEKGRLIITMINPVLSAIGHRYLWWYGEHETRGMEEGEVYGFWNRDLIAMLALNGFELASHERFLYRLNNLFVFRRAEAA